jgi:hypothetical protein
MIVPGSIAGLDQSDMPGRERLKGPHHHGGFVDWLDGSGTVAVAFLAGQYQHQRFGCNRVQQLIGLWCGLIVPVATAPKT